MEHENSFAVWIRRNGEEADGLKDFRRADLLFSLCGLNCGLCPMHLDGHCPGCGGGEGNQSCKIARCSLQHGKVEYCSRCQEFPCEKYEEIDTFDSFITHQNQKRDLIRQKEAGAEAYRAEQEERLRCLKWLLKNCNDGRKKTFFCVAVNLLRAEDVRNVLKQAESDGDFEALSLKEKAAYMAGKFQKIADEQGILLKLRKKK